MSPKATVAGIILKDKKILLEKRSRKMIIEGGKWCLPGGYIDFGETAEQGIKREIKEELGLTVKKANFLFYKDEIKSKLRLYNVVLVFEAKVVGKIKTGWEVAEVKWFTKKEIEKLNMAFSHKDIIKRFFKEKR